MKIKLNNSVSIDLDRLIESRMLVQANSGGGKSWALRRFIEQAFGKKQIIIIDPEGEFGNLRSKYDFVYVGKDGDAPAEPRSAAMLARRLLETKANAIIDIYELGSRRGDFVKAFLDACVNMPKELWTDCFFVLDEAHKFAPEKGQGESVALSSVIDMASLGRKRGYCLIPATQRPSKLSKDVVAECNNKLIGRASLDIDRKRSAEELGFNTKEEILSLRNLQPGEFYVFGTAISNEVIKTTIGDVNVKPPKRGSGRTQKIAPPTAKVKAILKQLADLPEAAEKEARTAAELKAQLTAAKRRIGELERAPTAPQGATPRELKAEYDRGYDEGRESREVELTEWRQYADTLEIQIREATKSFEFMMRNERPPKKRPAAPKFEIPKRVEKPPEFEITKIEVLNPGGDSIDVTLGKGEKTILNAIAQYSEGITNEHIAILTGYKATSRRVYLQKLVAGGFVEKQGANYVATGHGIAALGSEYQELPKGRALLEHWLEKLPEGERKILQMVYHHNGELTRQEISDLTGYKSTSVRVYVQKLMARQILEHAPAGAVKIVDTLYE